MRTRPGFGSRLPFSLRTGRFCTLSILAIAAFACSTAHGQTPESTQSAGSPTTAPISSFLNLDSTRRAANPQSSPATATAIPLGITAPTGYKLSVDDQIAVEVFGEDDLRTAVRINAEGAVSLPLLGSVNLSGLTLNQAAARLTELYGRDYLVNPKVNVMLISYAKRRFSILGQVNRPSNYEMPESSPGGIDLLEAVAMAGGYTRIAAPERITVRRHNANGDQIFKVNAKRFTKGSGGGFLVEPGDTITVGESIF